MSVDRTSRPAAPDTSIARRIRGIVGVQEEALDWVSADRARYTRMGAIILITGVLSGLSMLVVTGRLFDGPFAWPAAIGMALFWGFAIVMLDSWLIASTHGGRAKTLVCLPRLLISILLGFVIAEPLVVMVFRPAIEQRVEDNRSVELASFTSVWKACNPPTGEVVRTPECADHHLNLASSLTALRTQHETLVDQRNHLKPAYDTELAQWNELERIARAECKGIPDTDTTGVPGEGPECSRNRATADQFRRDAGLEQRQADLTAIDRDLTRLTESIKQTEKSYGEQVESAIALKVADWQASRATIGILEEFHALGQLAAESAHVNGALWGLRLLLILIDCMPVLTKWMSPRTAYDQVIANETAAGKRLHDQSLRQRERTDTAIWDAHYSGIEDEYSRTSAQQAQDAQRARELRELELDEEIERLAEQYRRG
ncbi:DUF4407 domain-containing protein [Kibdelosporangium philippinense]|uniref:DUF4407 domain-containing protein n=1 Tax=Kibdelosporangium philippinense TaxID=211113 RepID=A0ABS8ZNW7_9PSEU|nr:DUF4407 domain-containing protein [Kibdelosporangium philippinense]MCE7009434.1 DUF4407 domain-containing protein [Kibdelosporangium philippinense]